MDQNFREEQNYLRAKKRVKAMKAFYIHFAVYIIVNIFLSGLIVFGLMKSGYTFEQAFSNFGVYSTWLFWGIGMFFHWLGVFGFKSLMSSDWEERKIKQLMKEDEERTKNF